MICIFHGCVNVPQWQLDLKVLSYIMPSDGLRECNAKDFPEEVSLTGGRVCSCKTFPLRLDRMTRGIKIGIKRK
jgi:hypothetical protein